MATEYPPPRFDSRYNFNGPSVYPLDLELIKLTDTKYTKLPPNIRNIAIRTYLQVGQIPNEELPIVAYDLDNLAIDHSFGRYLLQTKTLYGDVSAARADIASSENPAEMTRAKNQKIREAITTHVTKLRIADVLGYTPGKEITIYEHEHYRHGAALITNVLFSSRKLQTGYPSAA